MTDRGYQHDFSLAHESMNSSEGRQQKAATMVAVLREALGDRLAAAKVLNLGCSTGIIDESISDHVAWVPKWAAPALIPIGILVVLSNISAWVLARLLPGSDFMPGGYDVIAVRTA